MGHGSTVLTRTYRHLLRKATEFDKNPSLKYLICKRSPLIEEEMHSVVDAFLGGRDYYLPSPVLPQSVHEAARVACRFPPEQSGSLDTALLGLKYLNSLSSIAAKHALEDTANDESEHKQPQQHHLEQNEQQQRASGNTEGRLEKTYAAETSQNSAKRQAEANVGPAQKPVVSSSAQSTLEAVAAPSRGCVLIAHPLLTGYWANAVILLLSDSPSGGCSGLLLCPAGPSDTPKRHQPRTGKVIMYPDGSTTFIEWASDSDSDEDEGDDEDDDSAEVDNASSSSPAPVNWVGGPVRGQALAEYTTHPAPGYSHSSFSVLHPMPGFWGLYRGYSKMHKEMQRSYPEGTWDKMRQEHGQDWCCHKFQGEALWGPMQLEEEMSTGCWICVRPNGSYLTHLWCQTMPAIMKLQSPGSTNRRRMRLLWRRLLADVGGQVAAARHVTPETAEEIMNDFTVTMTRDGKTYTL